MGRLISLPDKEEVPGSNPGAPTSDLQGFLPRHVPPGRPLARFLQPKCVVVVRLVCGSGTSLTPGLDGLKRDYFERRQYTVSRLPDAAALKRASTALA